MNEFLEYYPNFLEFSEEEFNNLRSTMIWERRDNTPRSESWSNDQNRDYTYGKGNGMRTYSPVPWNLVLKEIQEKIKTDYGYYLSACFTNFYNDGTDHLGWHSDDDPNINHDNPIAVISFGEEREIWFRKIGDTGETRESLLLQNGSLLFMMPGCQRVLQHRIPKSSKNVCGPRISLTYRSLFD